MTNTFKMAILCLSAASILLAEDAKPSPIGYRTATVPVRTDTVKTREIVPMKGDGTACFFRARSGLGEQLNAAHASFPLGSQVRVTNVANGTSVIVTITGRIPSTSGIIVSVSRLAAERLSFENLGTAQVRLELLSDHISAL